MKQRNRNQFNFVWITKLNQFCHDYSEFIFEEKLKLNNKQVLIYFDVNFK